MDNKKEDEFFHEYIENNYAENEKKPKNTEVTAVEEESFDEEENVILFSDEELENASKENISNQKNEEEFNEVMDNASRNLDGYWDRNNTVIRVIIYLLWGFAGLGFIYYLFVWLFLD